MDASAIPRFRHSGMVRRTRPGISRFRVRIFDAPRNDSVSLAFKMFVGDDLDAETGQSLVVVHRRGEMPDRGDAEVAQDLRADAAFAPLPVAVGFGGFLLAERRHR